MEPMSPKTAELLLQENNYLISLPEVCINLKKVLANPLHSTKDISQVISYDPGLTTRVLRIVNSAYYSLPAPATDISYALTILGERDLNNLVIVSSIVQTMNSIDTEVDLKHFWKISIFSAVLTRNIANKCLKKKREELFIVGLLLKVGMLLTYHHEAELFQHVQEQVISSGRQDYIIEKELLGYNHAEVGAMMSQSWNFSIFLADLIATQYTAPEKETSSISHYIISLTNYCLNNLGLDLNKMDMPEELALEKLELIEYLSIPEDVMFEILTSSYEEYFSVHDSFVGAG